MLVIQLDYTLLIQMANFLALLWILNRFIYKPILGVLDERKKRLEESERIVNDLKDKTSQKWEAYEAELQRAKLAATSEKERLKAEGLEAERKVLEEAREEAARIMNEARSKVEDEIRAAREVLRGQGEVLGMEIAEKILGRALK